jgi:hypothetical protein
MCIDACQVFEDSFDEKYIMNTELCQQSKTNVNFR